MDSWDAARPGRSRPSRSLGARIARLRADRAWTQQQLADRIGISRVAVSHLETDMNVPGERTVALLAGCFRLEPHELVADTTYPPAKADRLPLVAARWTDVELHLDRFERDLWWLRRLADESPTSSDGVRRTRSDSDDVGVRADPAGSGAGGGRAEPAVSGDSAVSGDGGVRANPADRANAKNPLISEVLGEWRTVFQELLATIHDPGERRLVEAARTRLDTVRRGFAAPRATSRSPTVGR